jgi:pimeloyl-ACP methyl ester carboxylesterase
VRKAIVAATAALTVWGLSGSTTATADTGAGAAPGTAPTRYERQPVTWHGCQDEALDSAGVRCADVTVPLDYARPDGRTIVVAISRLRAADPAHRIGTLIINTGGPGGPGLSDVLPTRDALKDVAPRYDLIGMDPRFVGRSTPLDCSWPTGTSNRSAGPDRAGFQETVAFEADLAARCARRQGGLLPYASTRNTARDIDTIRAVLAQPKLSFLGYSYGTYLGSVYLQMFPRHVDRVVLDSAVDPARYGGRMLRDVGPANEAALRDWAAWTARRDDQYGLGATRDAVLATVRDIYRRSANHPLRIGDYEVDAHVVPLLLISGLADDRDDARAALADMVRALDRTELTPVLAENLTFILTGSESTYGSAQASILCADVPVPRDPEVYWRDIQRHRADEPLFGPLTRNISPCAFWPDRPREQPTDVHNGRPALIVAADGDPRAIYPYNLALHRRLTGSRMITLQHAQVHTVYGNYGNTCVDDHVNAYLRDGVLPSHDLTCQNRPPQLPPDPSR